MAQFERGGYVFDVATGGDPSGIPVVLLHGFPQDSGSWSDVVPPLHRAGYRTLALDMRGVSPGARPTSLAEYRAVEGVNDVVALLDAEGIERAHIVGHDWGGYVGWAFACEHPQRVLTMTSVSTPHPAAFQRALLRSTQALQAWFMVVFQIPYLSERLLTPGSPMWRAIVRGLPRDHAERYAKRLADPQARTAALSWYRIQPRELAAPSVHWSSIEAPTMYVWGERDPSLGRTAAQLTQNYVTGSYRFEQIKAGHWIPETRPVLLASLLIDHLGSA